MFIKFIKIALLIFLFNIFYKMFDLYIQNNKSILSLKSKVLEEEILHNKLLEKEELLTIQFDNLENLKEIEKIARNVLNLKKEEEEIYRLVN